MQKDLLQVEKKCYLDNIKKCDPAKVKEIENEFKVKYAYDTVYILGTNVITLEEAFALYRGKLDKQVSERERKEFFNHIKAYEYLLENLDREISEDLFKDLHQLLQEDILPGGLYRQVNVRLQGLHQPPDYIKVYDRMKRMMRDLETKEMDTIEKAAFILLTLSKIYPFISGNGRLGRLLMNYYLMNDGYIPISFDLSQRREYYEAIDDFKVNKTMDKMVELIEQTLLTRYDEINDKLE